MMTPAQIRAGLIALLTGTTSAGARVYDTRMLPFTEGQALPAIDVTVNGSRADAKSASVPRFQFVTDVDIEGTVAVAGSSADSAVADAVHTLEGQILAALFQDSEWWQSFQQVAFSVDYGASIEGRQKLGAVSVSLTLTQDDVVWEHAPDPADDLETVYLEVDLATPDTIIDSEQQIDIEVTP